MDLHIKGFFPPQQLLRRVLWLLPLSIFAASVFADHTISLRHSVISVGENSELNASFKLSTAEQEQIELVNFIFSNTQLTLVSHKTTANESAARIVSTFIAKDLKLDRTVSADLRDELITIDFLIINTSDTTIELAQPVLSIANGYSDLIRSDEGFGSSLVNYRRPFVTTPDSVWSPDFHDIERDRQFSNEWFGWTNRQTLVALKPVNTTWRIGYPVDNAVELSPQNLTINLEQTPQALKPNEQFVFTFQGILLPKSRQLLASTHPQLEPLIFMNLWNWFRSICLAIWAFIEFLFQLTGSWGITIILLGCIVSLVNAPVTRYSLMFNRRAISQGKRLRPKLDRIKETYQGVERSRKIVQLYETEDFDHLASLKSMASLAVQIPVFVAVFSILAEAYDLNGVSFLWISDLARPDRLVNLDWSAPYFGRYLNLLPIIMALVMFLSAWLAAQSSGSSRGVYWMPGLFLILLYSFPSSLVLYWLSTNLVQLIQVLVGNRKTTR